jgi:formylglycine-generating enzyme required for sulfatase activity
MPHIFISYAKKDTRELALVLSDALNAIDGVTAWVDRSLRAGRSWELQIQNEIDRCDAMVVLYSPDINRHKQGEEESYVLTEIAYAKRTAKKQIIPVMAQRTDPPMSLTMEHYIDFTLTGLKLDDLIEAIRDELNITTKLTQPINSSAPTEISQLGETDGYKEAIRAAISKFSDPIQTALQRARSFTGKRNRDWQPFITTFPDLKIPDMTFCLVPVGEFLMGSDDGHFANEQPVHSQIIEEPYWIAQYPLTNRQWAMGVKAGVVKEPLEILDSLKWYKDPNMADTPVDGATWFMVNEFADWLGCRLPTEREWEYAARGVESLRYPWGNDWSENLAVWGKNSGGKPAPVTTKPEGKSWVGAQDLIGNVWEWTASLYDRYPYPNNGSRERDTGNRADLLRVLRGGSRMGPNIVLRSACRYNGYSPVNRNSTGGVRFVLS